MFIFKSANKNKIILFIIFILVLFIPAVSYFVIKSTSPQAQQDKLINFLNKYDKKGLAPNDKYKQALSIINNKNSNLEKRYEGLKLLAFYIQDTYYKTNDPKIRNHLELLREEAKNSFPKQYHENDFLVACADPDCGDKPDSEAINILKDVNNLGVDNFYKKTIATNLRVAFYLPYNTKEDKMEKLISYNLVHFQLLELNDRQASATAETLKSYILKKYNKDITNQQSLPVGL